jgi:sporulation integral membrane protein YtvI
LTEKVEKRRATLINLAYIVVILALFYLFFKFCLPFAAPFLISFFVAVILQRPLKWMDKKSKGKCHALWSILLVLLLILLVIGPIVIIFSMLFKEIAGFVSFLANQLNDTPTLLATIEKELLDLLKFLPDGLYTKVSDSITQTFGSLIHDFDLSKLGIDMKSVSSGVSSGITGIFSFVKNIPSILIGVVIGIISAIFFTKDYRRVVNFIKLQLPDNNKNILVEIKQVFFNTVLKMLRAYGIIMFITFCELFIGMSIMKVAGIMHNNYIFIIAICIAIFDILPVAGSGGILIPWLLISFIVGNVAQGIGLLVLYIVLSVVRQYIEPKIVGESLGVHPLITLAGLYFGLKLFGFYGMFIVPLSLMTIKAFNDTGRIHLYVPPQTHEEKK